MFFMIQCTDKAGASELRRRTLPQHKVYLEERRHLLIWAGARQWDDGETIYGSFYLLKVPDRAAAEAFIENEPFYCAGLFETVELSNVRRGIFHPELAQDQG